MITIMLFSVLIPVYNTSKYLDECIQSVLSQTEKDYEIVLIDDGSTDNSGDICDGYAEQYPFIRVIHKENEGLMMTRRRGFKEAKGEYFICLDSDDYLCDDEALAKIKKMIVEKNCDLVLYNYLMEKETRDKDRQIILFDKPDGYVFSVAEKTELYHKLLIGRDLNAIFAKVIKKSIIDRDVDYSQWKDSLFKSQGEDLFQSMPVLTKAERIGYIKDIVYFYRWNGGSISRNIQLEYYYAYKTIYQREDEYIKIWNIDNDVVQKNRLNRITAVMSGLVYCYSHTNDRKYWLKFVDELSLDEFFLKLFDVQNKRQVLLYYRLLGFFIRHRMKLLLQFSICTVSAISRAKNRVRKG